MNHPREPFERLLDVFDDPFKAIAEREGFIFDPSIGHVRRALRLKNDPLKRGVYLEFKDHWMQSDPIDPEVFLGCSAWTASHVLIKKFYEGKLSGLTKCIGEKLRLAVSEVKTVSDEIITRDGVSLADLGKGLVKL